MSDVQRFGLVSGHHVLPEKDGRFVEYVAYEKLALDLAELRSRYEAASDAAKAEADAWRRCCAAQRNVIDALDAELEAFERKGALRVPEGHYAGDTALRDVPKPSPELWQLRRELGLVDEEHYEPTVEEVEEAYKLWRANHEVQQLILRLTYRRRRWWQFWR